MTLRPIRILILTAILASEAFGQVPFLYLERVNIGLDSATYAAISSSLFLRDTLAGTRSETATTEDGTWSGTILAGENNSIGFSATGTRSELVLRCEQSGCSAGIAQILEAIAPGSPRSELRHRVGATGSTPWYTKTWSADLQSDAFSCWFYEPYADSTVPDRELGRKAMNARWYKAQRLLGNVVEVTVALNSGAIRKLTHRLSAFRFAAMFSGSATKLAGPDLSLNLEPGSRGVTRIVFALNSAKEGQKEYRFGPASVLRFDNTKKTATWTF